MHFNQAECSIDEERKQNQNMNFKRLITILMIAFVIPFYLSCIASAENLLENSDFMQLNNEGLPSDWYTDAYVLEPGYSVFSISEGDPEHPLALVIQNIGENDARFAQTVDVDPESLYLLSGYIKAEGIEGGHGANLSVEGVYAFSEEYYDTAGEWAYIEYYGETGPEQDYLTVFARLGGYSGVSTGKAYFADLSLTKVASAPGDIIADRWYKESISINSYDTTEEGSSASGSFWPWLMIIGTIFVSVSLIILYKENQRNSVAELDKIRIKPVFTGIALLLALLLRIIICWIVEGYMVDVNCFLSWGSTMASVGPARFYEATSFCDYPPLYTYVLALNSVTSSLLGNGAETARVVYRMIPCLCDLAGCWILYMLLRRQKNLNAYSCFFFFILMLFNPATILNSAAWGQMDSVLCLLLLTVVILATESEWIAALPLYVVAVLVKPQALMLGPLGLTYLILIWIRKPQMRKRILCGTGISILILGAGVIPFGIYQDWDWLIRLYGRTLASYPYATVNTANFYYILGGNWSAVEKEAATAAPIILGILCTAYGVYWYQNANERKWKRIETIISIIFATAFILCACFKASWAVTGGLSMAFAFVIVLGSALRSGNIKLLPWLGALLYILLYVFGIKMHERYVFPALLLLAAAWILLRDRRILYILILFTVTVFINEGIVLDNSIRLGSRMGHLNSDTVWLADIISLLNIFGSIYAVWLNNRLYIREPSDHARERKPYGPNEWKTDRTLRWGRKDTIILSLITCFYAIISLSTLGSTKAPQTTWSSSSPEEQIIFDLGEVRNEFEILYFAQVSRYDFSFSVSDDGVTWDEETWAQMDQGQCWKWKYVTESYENGNGEHTFYNSDENHIVRFTGRYVRLTACQLGLKLNEVLFRNSDGQVLPVSVHTRMNEEPESELYSDPDALTDEQDSIEKLPSLFAYTGKNQKTQPSWWNSTYFDEIYHARTAYEFIQKTVPYETSHPPLGKVLMSAGIAIFGMTPFGWRFAGALAGILMLPGMYLLAKQLTKKTWIAAMASLLMALDCMHLTQTQIATIDSFPVLFIIFAYYFMLRFLQTDYLREKLHKPLLCLFLSGLFMGFSIASKWIGIYAGAGLAVLFFWHCIRMARLQSEAIKLSNDSTLTEPERKTLYSWIPGQSGTCDATNRMMILCAWCILFFIIIPIIIYLVSYIPYMAYNAKRIHSFGDYIAEVWRSQVGMFNYHSTPNLGMDHPFYSPWWEWPLIGKPMYYAAQQYLPYDNPVHHSIFCFGNPVIWYGSLAAMAFCIIRSVSNRRYRIKNNNYLWHLKSTVSNPQNTFIMIGFLAQYLPWVLVPRGTYIYHYFASLPFLMLSICLCFNCFSKPEHEKNAKICAAFFTAVAAIFFVLLFPYASGMNVSSSWLNIGKTLLKIWY